MTYKYVYWACNEKDGSRRHTFRYGKYPASIKAWEDSARWYEKFSYRLFQKLADVPSDIINISKWDDVEFLLRQIEKDLKHET